MKSKATSSSYTWLAITALVLACVSTTNVSAQFASDPNAMAAAAGGGASTDPNAIAVAASGASTDPNAWAAAGVAPSAATDPNAAALAAQQQQQSVQFASPQQVSGSSATLVQQQQPIAPPQLSTSAAVPGAAGAAVPPASSAAAPSTCAAGCFKTARDGSLKGSIVDQSSMCQTIFATAFNACLSANVCPDMVALNTLLTTDCQAMGITLNLPAPTTSAASSTTSSGSASASSTGTPSSMNNNGTAANGTAGSGLQPPRPPPTSAASSKTTSATAAQARMWTSAIVVALTITFLVWLERIWRDFNLFKFIPIIIKPFLFRILNALMSSEREGGRDSVCVLNIGRQRNFKTKTATRGVE